MRQFIIASHAHFAAGINEALELLSGEHANVRTISMFVDGNMDVAAAAQKAVEETPEGDEIVVVTDLFGGSVNNEFLKIIQTRPEVCLVSNMNLPLLLQLMFADEDAPAAQVIREIVSDPATNPVFVNDTLSATDTDEDEEF